MAMKLKFELVAEAGKYTDKEGNEKKRWLKCGSILERDDGSLVVKLESLPVAGFTGWMNAWTPEPKDGKPAKPAKSFDDDIGF